MSDSRSYRAKALQNIGRLSATTQKRKHSDIEKLYEAHPGLHTCCKGRNLAQTPITIAELDILFALCRAAPLLNSKEEATQLLDKLSTYLSKAHAQAFVPSPFLRFIGPSPWEALTYELTRATLVIGLKHNDLHDAVLDGTVKYLRNCLYNIKEARGPERNELPDHVEAHESLEIAAISVSLLGFLEAASQHTDFYGANEKLDMLRLLREILNENFMVKVEGVFSSIRTSDSTRHCHTDWMMYTKRYAASGRPLGAMILQRNFMRLLVSCSSLQVCTAKELRKSDAIDILTTEKASIANGSNDAKTDLVELMADLATESMRLLQDGSDYLELGSAWQRHLAFSVQAHSIHTFLNCMVADEEIADVEMLVSWLEDAMGDPIQMADDTLAAVVLRSMTVIAKFSPSIASTLSRSLPRFLVQGGIKGDTVVVAARSLTYILRQLSQDAILTGLYSLGNILSAGSGTDRTARGTELANGNTRLAKTAGSNNQMSTEHSTGSAISLALSGEEETSDIYGAIVRAVVNIATTCQDDKIAALAQSMLLQKLGRISVAVDLHIIKEAAVLALAGGEAEFKSLLKLFDRLSHEGIRGKDDTLLAAVRHHNCAFLYTFALTCSTRLITLGCISLVRYRMIRHFTLSTWSISWRPLSAKGMSMRLIELAKLMSIWPPERL